MTSPQDRTPRRGSASAAACALFALLACTAGMGWAAAQGGDGCAAAKLLAASQRAASKVACHAEALKKGVAVDAVCLATADAKFAAAFAKVEAKGGCTLPGDADSIASDADACVSALVADEPVAP